MNHLGIPWATLFVMPQWLADACAQGLRLRARVVDFYHAESNVFSYHLCDYLRRLGFDVIMDNTEATQIGISCGPVTLMALAKLHFAGALWADVPALDVASVTSAVQVEQLYESRRQWEERSEVFRDDHTRMMTDTDTISAVRHHLATKAPANASLPINAVCFLPRSLFVASCLARLVYETVVLRDTKRYYRVVNTVDVGGLHWIGVLLDFDWNGGAAANRADHSSDEEDS